MIAVNGVWTIAGVGEEWAARARRVMRLVLDGLRFGAGA
jgi:hypothetical protein